MKRVLSLLVVAAALSTMGAAYWISQDAALVSGALTELKFESVRAKSGLIGGPPKFRVTKDTIKYLKTLLNEGKTIEVQNNGAVKILDGEKS
ncbi:MAG: hypothetical protein WD845_03700 [Pirellulales bacterium]